MITPSKPIAKKNKKFFSFSFFSITIDILTILTFGYLYSPFDMLILSSLSHFDCLYYRLLRLKITDLRLSISIVRKSTVLHRQKNRTFYLPLKHPRLKCYSYPHKNRCTSRKTITTINNCAKKA